jgi:hypothetical protein
VRAEIGQAVALVRRSRNTMLGMPRRHTGLGAAADVDELQRKLTRLEQAEIDLTAQMEERAEELRAAPGNAALRCRMRARKRVRFSPVVISAHQLQEPCDPAPEANVRVTAASEVGIRRDHLLDAATSATASGGHT